MRRELNIWVVEEKCRGGNVEMVWAGREAGRIEGQGGKQGGKQVIKYVLISTIRGKFDKMKKMCYNKRGGIGIGIEGKISGGW